MNSDALQLRKSKNKRYHTTGWAVLLLLNYKAVKNRLRQFTRTLRRTYEMNLAMNIGSKQKASSKKC